MSERNRLRALNEKTRFLRFLFIPICLGLGLNPSLSHAQSSKTSSVPEKATIAHATTVNSTPVYVAAENAYFKPGLDVSLHAFPSGIAALNEVLKGKADFATVAETPFMYAVLNRSEVSVIATISTISNSMLLIARKDKGVESPGDLKGKKIGAARGTAVDFFLDNILVFNGIPKKDVEKVNLPPETMLGPLQNGEIDGAVHWEPYAHELVTALGVNAFTFSGLPTYNKYTWNLVAQKGWIDKNPETVRKVIQAIIQGTNFIKKDPSEARKIVARYSKMNETEISRMWGSTVFKVALHSSLLMSLEDQARWAIRNQYTAAKAVPNFLNYIYFEGLAAVEPAAVTIVH